MPRVDDAPQTGADVRRTRLNTIGTFVVSTAIFTYGFWTFLILGHTSDMGEHIEYAQRIRSIADLTSPHFLFQLMLKAVQAVGPSSYFTAAAWVLGICYGGMAVLIAREIQRRGVRFTATHAYFVVPALLIASHIFLPTLFPPRLYDGYFVPISYHNPTQQVNKLFTLWIYFMYCAQFLDSRRAGVVPALSTGGLVVLSALAKPSFLIAFLPTAGLFALADLVRRRWRQVLMFGFGIALPAVLILVWQAAVTYTPEGSNRVVFAPFEVFHLEPTLYKLPASLAFPIVVAAMAVHARVRDPKFVFAWVFTAIALFATLFLGETQRMMDGNFAWTGQTAVFLIYVESFLLLIGRPELSLGRRVAWATLTVHVVCGLIWYGTVFSPNWVRWL
jgi:hypothetical protein